jgi:hypothetical protein
LVLHILVVSQCNRRTLFPKARSAGLNHEANSQLHRSCRDEFKIKIQGYTQLNLCHRRFEYKAIDKPRNDIDGEFEAGFVG